MGTSAEPSEQQKAEDASKLSARAVELQDQVETFLARYFEFRDRAGMPSEITSPGTPFPATVNPLKDIDIHEAAARAEALKGQLAGALTLYKRWRSFARMRVHRAPTIILHTADLDFEVPQGRKSESPFSGTSPVPKSPKSGRPMVRQRSVQYATSVQYMADREVSTGVDSRQTSFVDFLGRRQSSCTVLDLSRQNSGDTQLTEEDVDTVARRAERVQSDLDEFTLRHRRVLSENKRLRSLLATKSTAEILEGVVKLGATAEALQAQLETLGARHLQLRARNRALEDRSRAVTPPPAPAPGLSTASPRPRASIESPSPEPPTGSPSISPSPAPDNMLTCSFAESDYDNESHRGSGAFQSPDASPRTRLKDANNETGDHEEILAAMKLEHESKEATWLDEKQELLNRIAELTRKVNSPSPEGQSGLERLASAPVSPSPGARPPPARRATVFKIFNEEVLMRGAIEKDQARGFKVLVHLCEVDRRRVARLSLFGSKPRISPSYVGGIRNTPGTRSRTLSVTTASTAYPIGALSPGGPRSSSPTFRQAQGTAPAQSPCNRARGQAQGRAFAGSPTSPSSKHYMIRPASMTIHRPPSNSARSSLSVGVPPRFEPHRRLSPTPLSDDRRVSLPRHQELD